MFTKARCLGMLFGASLMAVLVVMAPAGAQTLPYRSRAGMPGQLPPGYQPMSQPTWRPPASYTPGVAPYGRDWRKVYPWSAYNLYNPYNIYSPYNNPSYPYNPYNPYYPDPRNPWGNPGTGLGTTPGR